MNIQEPLVRGVLIYVKGMGKPISLYEFDRALRYKFGFMSSAGFCLRFLLSKEYLMQIEEVNEMQRFIITEKGDEYVRADFHRASRSISLIEDVVEGIFICKTNVVDKVVTPPFFSFACVGRRFKFAYVPEDVPKIKIELPTDRNLGVDRRFLLVDDLLSDKDKCESWIKYAIQQLG